MRVCDFDISTRATIFVSSGSAVPESWWPAVSISSVRTRRAFSCLRCSASCASSLGVGEGGESGEGGEAGEGGEGGDLGDVVSKEDALVAEETARRAWSLCGVPDEFDDGTGVTASAGVDVALK